MLFNHILKNAYKSNLYQIKIVFFIIRGETVKLKKNYSVGKIYKLYCYVYLSYEMSVTICTFKVVLF